MDTHVYVHDSHLDTSSPYFPIIRQTYYSNGRVGDFRFSTSKTEHDAYFVTHAVNGPLPECLHRFDKSKRICVIIENPEIWRPTDDYLNNMGVVITSFPMQLPSHIKQILCHPAAGWFYGMKFQTDVGLSHNPVPTDFLELQDLAELHKPHKDKLISFICSQKVMTPGHAWRISIAKALESYFGNNIDLYGFGWKPISDKREAIDRYKFSISIENCESLAWWTEKLSDPILGYSIPIYSGATQIKDYFQADFPTVKYGIDPDSYVQKVKNIIEMDWPESDLYVNRHRLLFSHNFYYFIRDIIQYNL
jgi:hypothetical protein